MRNRNNERHSRNPRPLRWSAAALVAVMASACGGVEDQPASSAQMNVVLPGDIQIDELFYEITGGGFAPSSGFVDVTGTGETAVFFVPLPAGSDYLLSLRASSTDETLECEGSTTFDILVGATTSVTVTLSCGRTGELDVVGRFNVCPRVEDATAATKRAKLGVPIPLSVVGSDAEGDTIAYAWSGAGGTFSDPTAPNTTFTCETEGSYTLSVVLTDSNSPDCSETWSVAVTCEDTSGGGGLPREPR